jgi:hypothetical protein
MTEPAIPSLRRRPIPGMSANTAPQGAPAMPETDPGGTAVAVAAVTEARAARPPAPVPARPRRSKRTGSRDGGSSSQPASETPPERRPAADYATTRLVNFRLPADLHDRYKQLVREAEERHPRLRHPSLTELIIALLEEGPATADEVAELIRRKRAAEHGLESPR